MDPRLRQQFNAAFSDAFYQRYLDRLSARLGGPIPFRVAETPLFVPRELGLELAASARAIVDQVTEPALIDKLRAAVPARFDVPRIDAGPTCMQVDLAIVRGPDGALTGRLVELQAFPSLYALMVLQQDVMLDLLREVGIEDELSMFFGGLDRDGYVARLKKAILAGEDPAHVVLLDIRPAEQKTAPDFVATKLLLGIDAVCATEVVRAGRTLYRHKEGRRVPIRRIYNRVVFDELERAGATIGFSYTDDLDLTWCPHPNWYWMHSKYTLPFIDHPAVPKTRTLAELESIPDDLERYVLKPMFSFAGAGVKIDPTRADVEAVPEAERARWLLQEKVTYEPALTMPDGSGVKAEMRLMFLGEPGQAKPELLMNLVRLSRGKMLGVDQNKDMTWVGGSLGLMPVG